LGKQQEDKKRELGSANPLADPVRPNKKGNTRECSGKKMKNSFNHAFCENKEKCGVGGFIPFFLSRRHCLTERLGRPGGGKNQLGPYDKKRMRRGLSSRGAGRPEAGSFLAGSLWGQL